MAKLEQGQVWWADMSPPANRRPVLLLTRNAVIDRLDRVTVAPMTRRIRGIPSEVILGPKDGLRSRCAVSLDNIATIVRTALDRRITSLSADRMREVFAGIRFAFDMPA